jgi:predicted NodU family carbamoyl transferase
MKIKTQPTRICGHSKGSDKGKFIAMSAYIKNSLTMYLKLLEKQEQAKLKTSSQGKTIKIRNNINETESRKNYTKINKK